MRPTPLARLRALARRLKHELTALSIAVRDPRTPWTARLLAGLVLAYALSPLDLIPDFIPVLGLLDDLLLLPLGLWLALRLIPPEVMREAREQARHAPRPPRSRLGLALVIGVYVLLLALLGWWLLRRFK